MKNKKLQIAVLMGGPSAEHKVSLNTGRMILAGLDKNKYTSRSIIISKKGKWPISFAKLKKNFDLAFIAMHGEYGEDGTIQSILEKIKMPYTGSNSKASKLGMDKLKSLKLFQKAGLNIPSRTSRPPLVIKPVDRGSSVGISIVKSHEELPQAIKLARKYSSKIMMEKYIEGREVACGVIERDSKLIALAPTEIIPHANSAFVCAHSHCPIRQPAEEAGYSHTAIRMPFFDYRAKYTPGASLEITPARLPKNIIKKIQQIAIKAHQTIGASGFSRTDMILEKSKIKNPAYAKVSAGKQKSKIYVLEINTIPGMTKTSLLPQGAKAIGIGFTELLDIIISSACKNF